jgi:leucyl-tRNA synthetase
VWQSFVLLLAPYAPHLAEELWEKLGEEPSIAYQKYPDWDEELAKEDTVTVVFQINGKIRAREDLPVGLSEDQLERTALEHPRIQELLAGKKPDKVIAVADKLVNLVVRSA